MAIDTIPHRLFARAAERPDVPAYYEKIDGQYRATTWGAYATLVRRAAKALIALGFERGSTVSILGFNRPEWVILDIAAMAAGGAAAGVYITSSPEEVRYIVHHAESLLVLVENADQWEKVRSELDHLPLVRKVVTMSSAPRIDHPMVSSWEAFLARGDGISDARLDERLASLEPAGLASLIYTSGTTGPPKGVMLSHDNLAWTTSAAMNLTRAGTSDVMLSYLPLSHIAEQIFSVHGHATAGYELYFCEAFDKLADNLREVRPTLFFGVPRVWEKLEAGITGKLAEAPAARRIVASAAMRVGKAYSAALNEGRMPHPLLGLARGAANDLVFAKVKHAIGLDRVRFAVTGAAPIATSVLHFFASLDLVVHEVYGQSEGTGPTSITRPGNNRVGTVGPPIPGVEVRFGSDGEILVRGRNVFMGYLKEPAATAETIVDGWLCSGDLGAFDDAGSLVITGRKKEIIITAGGKNITPKNIEGALKEHPLIAEAVVVGDRRRYLTALLVLDADSVARATRDKGIAAESGELRAEIQRIVDDVNARHARVEGVKKFHVLPQPFTIGSGELTPTLKIKRRVVYERYAREIDAMYEGE